MFARIGWEGLTLLGLVIAFGLGSKPSPAEPRPNASAPLRTSAVGAHDSAAAPGTTPAAALGTLHACPLHMVHVTAQGHARREQRQAPSPAGYCIDRYEASLERQSAEGHWQRWPGNLAVSGVEGALRAAQSPGFKPQGYISGKQAKLACERAGKRLCTSREWLLACRGNAGTRYPYGDERRAGVCNDRFKGITRHPVARLFAELAPVGSDPKEMWNKEWLNHPRLHELDATVSAAGSLPECVSDLGVFDMVGNLHEWVADDGGTFRGGYFMDTYQHGEGCSYRTTAHSLKYHDYSTGFRCCSEVSEELP